MTEQAEAAFVKSFLNILSNQPIVYADDYQQPPENSLKRVPVLPIDLPPPPKRKRENTQPIAASLSLTFKSLKPPKSFNLSVQPTDTVQTIKGLLASQPNAPPADAQRLLLKGKALADSKLLKEYNIKDGDTVNLMIKPGHSWDPNSNLTPVVTDMSSPNPKQGMTLGHSRIPSVVLSPSPSSTSPALETDKPLDINLTLDTSEISMSSESATHASYHTTIAQPEFWSRLFTFLRSQFTTESDAHMAFEDFLLASKGTLTASEIAKIRDEVGVMGMAGQ